MISDTITYWKRRTRRFVRIVLRSHHTPQEIAWGAALGVFVGFTPLMGCQMIISAVVATVFRISRLPAITLVYVTNPLTAPIIYPACYWLGVRVLVPFGFEPLRWAQVKGLFTWPQDLGFMESVWAKLQEILSLSWEGMLPLWLGCILGGLAFGSATYAATLRFVTGHRLLKAQRVAKRVKKRLDRIQRDQEREHNTEDDLPHDRDTQEHA